MNKQKNKPSGNPNADDSNFTGFNGVTGTGFRPNDNLRAKLKTNNKKAVGDLQITSFGLNKPIKMKAEWNP